MVGSGDVVADEIGVGFQIADQRVILSEGEVALLVWVTDEAFDVFEPAGAGFQGLLASGIDGRGRVLFNQIAKSHDGSQRLGSSSINGRLGPLAAGFAEQRRPFCPPSAGGEHWSTHSGNAQKAAELPRFQTGMDL
jgi:hypothetical protein